MSNPLEDRWEDSSLARATRQNCVKKKKNKRKNERIKERRKVDMKENKIFYVSNDPNVRRKQLK